jgi:hypothetical protein
MNQRLRASAFCLLVFWLCAPALARPPAHERRVCVLEAKQCYRTLAEAAVRVRDGQTIELEPGVYERDVAVIRSHRVRVQVRDGGRAIFEPRGFHAFGKAILVTHGNGIVLSNLTFRNAKVPHGNGAGVRHEGADLTVKNCSFENNEMGLLTGDNATGHIQIYDSVFSGSRRQPTNVDSDRSPPAHNIYVGRTERLTLRGVWSHSSHVGHTLKSRARNNDIEASYFSTRQSNGSYEVEFPSGGAIRFVGNIVEQGPNSQNRRMLAIGMETAHTPNRARDNQALIAQNTFINRFALLGDMIAVRRAPEYQPVLSVHGNVWVGPGAPEQHANLSGSATVLINADRCDFRLKNANGSLPAGLVPTAQFEYVHPARHQPRSSQGFGALSAENNAMTTCD